MSEKVTYHPAIWGGKKLAYPNVPPDGPKFSAAVVAGNLVFISGCQGANDETMLVETDVFNEQMVIALDKVRACMERAGSSMDNVIKMTILLTDRKNYPAMRRTEFEYYRAHAPRLVEDPPASTVMVVGLGKPEYLVELDAVGVVSR
jgi:2-iminobutanoate/2-iminopropanoate deaminase